MFCSNCGGKVSIHDNFCMNCGTKLYRNNQNEKSETPIFTDKNKEDKRNVKSNSGVLEYFKNFLLKPHRIINSNNSVNPMIPLIILLSWILINTFLTIGAIKNTIKVTITKIIESIPIPEMTSGSEYVDDIISSIMGETGLLPEWANSDYLIDGLFEYINPYYISFIIMFFIILVITYNITFLYFVPSRERNFSKIITDYVTLYFTTLVSTTVGLLIINVGLIYPGIFIITFGIVFGLLAPLYLLFYYTKNGRYKLDLVYSIIVYVLGIVIIYFVILHGLILRTFNNFMEQVNIITEFFSSF